MDDLRIAVDDPRRPDVAAVIERHRALAHEVTPFADVHALGLRALLEPSVTFFTARVDGEVMAIGALRQLDDSHAELKSMHTLVEARGRGLGRAMVEHLLTVAADRGCRRVSLETGTMESFEPARLLYESVGFEACEPFGDYRAIPGSMCMTMELDT